MKMSAIKRPRLDVAKINELSDNAGHCVHNSVTGRKSIQVTHHHAPQMHDDPSSNNNKKKQVNFSTLGRKGDPRMHLAMIARLKKPSMSLQDALEQGGFAFVKSKNGEMMDTDSVQLRQRKNQLSRRLRLHRNQAKEAVRGDDVNDQIIGDTRIDRLPQDRKDSENVGNIINAPLTTSIFTTTPSLSLKSNTCQETPALVKNSPYNRGDGSSSPKAAARLDGMVLSKSTSDHFGNEPQHTQMQQHSQMQQNPPLKSTERGKMESALENFRIDASSLLKSCMLKAGFSHGDTDECDESYLAFSELALGKELERLSRIRFRMGHRSSSSAIPLANTMNGSTCLTHSAHGSQHQRHGIGANSNQISWQGNERLLQNAHEQSHHSHDHMHNNHQNQKTHEQSHHSHDHMHNNHQNQKTHEHSHHSHDHSHDHMHKSHHNDFNLNGNLPQTDHQDHDRTEGCIYSRHRHFLDGKCGHQAVIHKPLDGAPHVDFIVDGKVECYQDIPLKSACWPSRFKNTELAPSDCPIAVEKNHDKCNASCREGKPPKLLCLDELNFDGEEWFRDFESESAGGAGTAAALDSFMKLSGLDTV